MLRSLTFPQRSRRAFTLVELFVVIAIVGVVIGLLLAAVQSARAAAVQLSCANNLRQIGIAAHTWHDTRSVLPPGSTHPSALNYVYGPPTQPYPLLNWGARLLPFLEQTSLWFSVESVYRSDPNVSGPGLYALSQTPLPVFRCPADPAVSVKPPPRHMAETTNYLGVSGRSSARSDGLLFLDSSVRLLMVTDGTSTTLLVGERPINEFTRGGRWTGGWGHWGTGDAYLGVRETAVSDTCPNYPYPFRRGTKADPCSFYHFWSFHPGGANFLFADGSVRFLGYSADAILSALATRDGGEVVSP